MAEQALINPKIISWARQRAGLDEDMLAQKLHIKDVQKIIKWEKGITKPTFKQAQEIANKTNIPFGYLYLNQPPQETLPIPDLRTVTNQHLVHLSIELKDILNQIIIKQEWYKDHLLKLNEPELDFIGKYNINNTINEVVQDIRKTINVPFPQKGTWEDYYRNLIKAAETARILVMRSGMVGNNTKRILDVSEFRGFAISDKIAPVIFINSSDAKTAQLFTFVHELAHLWIGASGISDLNNNHKKEEKFCNNVAGEFLVPKNDFEKLWDKNSALIDNLTKISSHFHVSKLVIAKRALDCKKINLNMYQNYYQAEVTSFKSKAKKKKAGGPSFYKTAQSKNSKIFSLAVVTEALSGRLLLRDAGHLLGIKPYNIKTYAEKLAL